MVNRATALLIASLLAASPFVAHGASLGGIPPEVINQIKSMPPAQQQALAKQYGIDLGALAGSGAGATAARTSSAPRSTRTRAAGSRRLPTRCLGKGRRGEGKEVESSMCEHCKEWCDIKHLMSAV